MNYTSLRSAIPANGLNNDRNAVLWRQLLNHSVAGKKTARILNSEPIDLIFLNSLGLTSRVIFERTVERADLERQVDALNSKIEATNQAIEACTSDGRISELPHSLFYLVRDQLKDWIDRNYRVAFDCDMSTWFGNSLGIVEIHLPNFIVSLKTLVESHLSSGLAHKYQLELTALIKILNDMIYRTNLEINEKINDLKKQINLYKQQADRLFLNKNFRWKNDIRSVHEVSWTSVIYNPKLTFNPAILEWLASAVGQSFLDAIDRESSLAASHYRTTVTFLISPSDRYDYSAESHTEFSSHLYVFSDTNSMVFGPNPNAFSDFMNLTDRAFTLTKNPSELTTLVSLCISKISSDGLC
jgi:hypothetical protein